MAAIEKAYTSYIAPECFPACVIFMEMNPRCVDVNVHPAKLEVKFSEEKDVFEAIYYTVKTALEEHEYRPLMELNRAPATDRNPLGAFLSVGEKHTGDQLKINTEPASYNPPKRAAEEYVARRDSYKDEKVFGVSSSAKEIFHSKSDGARESISPSMTPKDSLELLARYRNASPTTEIEKNSVPEQKNEAETAVQYKIIGEAFDCYVMVQTDTDLLIIDKHAAHERILFEELKAVRQSDGRISLQSLLLPITVVLSAEELSALSEYGEDIRSLGFDFNINSGAADLLAVPGNINVSEAEDLLIKMLDEIIEGRGNPAVTDSIRKEKALYQIACKAAIKGGRVYDKAIVEWLVKKVLMLPDITVCPHGRPIAYRLTKTELDRQFDRIK